MGQFQEMELAHWKVKMLKIFNTSQYKEYDVETIICDTNFWIDLATDQFGDSSQLLDFINHNNKKIKVTPFVMFELMKYEKAHPNMIPIIMQLMRPSQIINLDTTNLTYAGKLMAEFERNNVFGGAKDIVHSDSEDVKKLKTQRSKWKHESNSRKMTGDCIIYYNFRSLEPNTSVLVSRNVKDFQILEKSYKNLYGNAVAGGQPMQIQGAICSTDNAKASVINEIKISI